MATKTLRTLALDIETKMGLVREAIEDLEQAARDLILEAEATDLPPMFVGAITSQASEFAHIHIGFDHSCCSPSQAESWVSDFCEFVMHQTSADTTPRQDPTGLALVDA